jgi:hypothetical protein
MAALSAFQVAAIAVSAGGTIMSTVGAYQQAQAQRASLDFQAAVARNNAITAGYTADAIVDRGEQQKADRRRAIMLAKGRVKPIQAAHGFLVDDTPDSSNAQFRADLAELGELDILRLNDDILLRERSARIQSTNFQSQSQLFAFESSSINPMMSGLTAFASGAGNTLATGFSVGGTTKGSVFFAK